MQNATLSRLLPLFCLAATIALPSGRPSLASERPNIIYIMGDDMGYSDIGCYGSEIETPNLDRLAAEGVRFSSFYNMARCCPTRASLLTGLYPHQAGVGWMMSDNGTDGYRGELSRNCMTIAEVLKVSGYSTYMSGKWHVTKEVHPKSEADKHNWPLQRGFERFYGTIHGAGSLFDPFSLTRGNEYISPVNDAEYQPENGFYYTDAISDHASKYIHEHSLQSSDKPFFMYVSYTAAHWPMHARDQDIAKYQGKYDAGYEAIRTARLKRLMNTGLLAQDSVVLPPMADSWDAVEDQAWETRNMEVYAAMVDSMDQGIGKIVAALRDTDQLDNTLLVYLQDNGGCAENYGRSGTGQPRAEAPTLEPLAADYLQPDMQPKQTRDGYPVRTGKGVMAGAADTYIAYGRGWATVSNTPFREYKHWVHEGGISSPLIVHWPAGFEARGAILHTPSHLVDLMATAIDAGQATYPEEFHDGKSIKPLEGRSLVPAIRDEPIEREALYWEHEGNRAVRAGDYKLVSKGAAGPWELYNLSNDRSEQHDLAAQQPQRVAELSRLWQEYALRSNVLPLTPYRAAKKSAGNQKQRRFELEQAGDLSGEAAPAVKGMAINFQAKLSDVQDGVLVAQGGVTHGWAVYIKDSRLCMAVTQAGKRTVVRSAKTIAGSGKVVMQWKRDGSLLLKWKGRKVAQLDSLAFLQQQPADGLQVGLDRNGSVGDYDGEFAYPGTISDVVIALQAQ